MQDDVAATPEVCVTTEKQSSTVRRVELSEPELDWGLAYEREREAIYSAFGGLGSVNIEHIGSTAIAGIRAKPIIDIIVGVDRFDSLRVIRARLGSLGYVFDEVASAVEPGRYVFRKGPDNPVDPRTHHLHLTLFGDAPWTRLIAFRDYLHGNPSVAREYERLKVDLAQRFADDGNSYTREKGEFVRHVEALANWRRPIT